MIKTYLQTETIDDINDKQEILNVLSYFDDEDFNGNNGDEYLWDEARKLGYTSNQEYVIKEIAAKESDTFNMIQTYFDEWLKDDSEYYDYDWNLHRVHDDKDTHTLTLVRLTKD